MRWNEQCIILSSRVFSESSRIVTVFNKSMGKTSGLLKSLKQPVHVGDIAEIEWKGRTLEQLGVLKIECLFSPFSFVFNHHLEILALESACTLCANSIPEKAPHEKLFETLKYLLLNLTQNDWLKNYVIFENKLLSEIGIGMDLSKCAVTGNKEGLFYISPRTGKAVIKEVGDKYKEKLFILPKFLINHDKPDISDILSALKITEHFFKMYFYGINDKQLPIARSYMIEQLSNGSVL